MFVLSAEGRGPFLEYLRNLGPQTVLFAVTLMEAKDLQLRCCDPSKTIESAVAAVFIVVLALAWWANTSQFVDRFLEYLTPPQDVELVKQSDAFRSTHNSWGGIFVAIQFMARYRTLKLLELALLMTVVQVCLVVVAVAAKHAAAQFLGR